MADQSPAPHLLHVVASPRHERSASRQVARAFVEAWQARHPAATVDVLDVWATDLPEFDGAALGAKYAGLEGRERTPEEAKAWADIQALAERFHRASALLLSVPMWNFGIPYRLKHLIDAISQKDVLFTFDERGLVGMLGGRKAVVVDARGVYMGADYPREQFDHQQSYMTTWLRMIGITDITHVEVEKTLLGAEPDHASRAAGAARAREVAEAA